MNQSQVMGQSCAITAHGGPRCLTFAPRRLKNRIVFIQIICSTLWLLQVQSSGLPSIFLTAQPQPTFYLISKTFQGLLTLQGFYPSMTTFLAAFFLASSSPQKEFSRTKMAIGVFYSQGFLKKFNAPMSRFRGPPILQNFHPGKMSKTKTKTKTNKPKTPQGFARFWEACVTEWLTPRTLDLEVRGSSLAGALFP